MTKEQKVRAYLNNMAKEAIKVEKLHRLVLNKKEKINCEYFSNWYDRIHVNILLFEGIEVIANILGIELHGYDIDADPSEVDASNAPIRYFTWDYKDTYVVFFELSAE